MLARTCEFCSAILGHKTKALVSADGFCPSPFLVREQETRHITFTAETHNFPTGECFSHMP